MRNEGEAETGEQVFKIELSPRKNAEGELVGMYLQIVVRGGDIVSITGTSTGDRRDEFDGRLTLRRRGRAGRQSELLASETGAANALSKESKDECWVCDENGCRWVKPCPDPEDDDKDKDKDKDK